MSNPNKNQIIEKETPSQFRYSQNHLSHQKVSTASQSQSRNQMGSSSQLLFKTPQRHQTTIYKSVNTSLQQPHHFSAEFNLNKIIRVPEIYPLSDIIITKYPRNLLDFVLNLKKSECFLQNFIVPKDVDQMPQQRRRFDEQIIVQSITDASPSENDNHHQPQKLLLELQKIDRKTEQQQKLSAQQKQTESEPIQYDLDLSNKLQEKLEILQTPDNQQKISLISDCYNKKLIPTQFQSFSLFNSIDPNNIIINQKKTFKYLEYLFHNFDDIIQQISQISSAVQTPEIIHNIDTHENIPNIFYSDNNNNVKTQPIQKRLYVKEFQKYFIAEAEDFQTKSTSDSKQISDSKQQKKIFEKQKTAEASSKNTLDTSTQLRLSTEQTKLNLTIFTPMQLVPVLPLSVPDRYDILQWLCFEVKSETFALVKVYPQKYCQKYVNEIRNIKKDYENTDQNLEIDEFSLIENFAIIQKAGDCSLSDLKGSLKLKREIFSEYFLISVFIQIDKQIINMQQKEILHGSINPHNIRLDYNFRENNYTVFLVNYFNEEDYTHYPGKCMQFFYDQRFETQKPYFTQNDCIQQDLLSLALTIFYLSLESFEDFEQKFLKEIPNHQTDTTGQKILFILNYIEDQQQFFSENYPTLSKILVDVFENNITEPNSILRRVLKEHVYNIQQQFQQNPQNDDFQPEIEPNSQKQQFQNLTKQQCNQINSTLNFISETEQIEEHQSFYQLSEQNPYYYHIRKHIILIQNKIYNDYKLSYNEERSLKQKIHFARRAGMYGITIQLVNEFPNFKKQFIFDFDSTLANFGSFLKTVDENMLFNYIGALYKIKESQQQLQKIVQLELKHFQKICEIIQEDQSRKKYRNNEKYICIYYMKLYFHILQQKKKYFSKQNQSNQQNLQKQQQLLLLSNQQQSQSVEEMIPEQEQIIIDEQELQIISNLQKFGLYEDQVRDIMNDLSLNYKKSIFLASKYANHWYHNQKIEMVQRNSKKALEIIDKELLNLDSQIISGKVGKLIDKQEQQLQQKQKLSQQKYSDQLEPQGLVLQENSNETYQEFGIKENDLQRAWLLEQKALACININIQEAKWLIETAVKLRKNIQGYFQQEVATAIGIMGNIYYQLNNQGNSLYEMQNGKLIFIDTLQHIHFEVASSYNNTAYLLPHQGKLEDSLKDHEMALFIRKKCFGEIHNDVALSYNNLAMTYSRLQKYQQSRDYQLRCLKIWQQVHGANRSHPNIATAYNNLASNESYLNNQDQALVYHKMSYKMKKALYGDENNQDMLISIDGIGLTYMKLTLYEKALKYQKRALKFWEELKCSRSNQNYAISLNNLSQTLKKKGDQERAFFLMKISFNILQKALGKQNPIVKNAQFNFISTKTEALKKFSTIKNLMRNLIEIIQKEMEEHEEETKMLEIFAEKQNRSTTQKLQQQTSLTVSINPADNGGISSTQQVLQLPSQLQKLNRQLQILGGLDSINFEKFCEKFTYDQVKENQSMNLNNDEEQFQKIIWDYLTSANPSEMEIKTLDDLDKEQIVESETEDSDDNNQSEDQSESIDEEEIDEK